jgi:hypothetical protein
MALLSDVPGIRVYFVGDRPLSGKWGISGSKDSDDEVDAPEERLDKLSIDGSRTSVRINWEGEKELPEMRPTGWQSLCSGTGRLFTTGRLW